MSGLKIIEGPNCLVVAIHNTFTTMLIHHREIENVVMKNKYSEHYPKNLDTP